MNVSFLWQEDLGRIWKASLYPYHEQNTEFQFEFLTSSSTLRSLVNLKS